MIHSSVSIDPGALLGENITVGPFACIGPDVEIGDRCHIGPHVVIQGPTRLGADNRISPHAVLGEPPQDLGYQGEPTRLEIGDRNIIREFVTIHRASTKEEHVTRVGNDNMFMAYSHIGHDCRVGNHVTMANAATLAGHVTVEDHVIIAGLCAIHQFARIGAYAMLGGGTMAPMDIPPYAMASGNHAKLYGLNRRGLQRNGFSRDDIQHVRHAYRLLFKSGLRLEQALEEILAEQALAASKPVQHLVQFIRQTKRGITR
ncbi:MAG: acyl-ACP--UDP-N-acetylglucosamine O-acyltransferase [Ectothiorhodospiraceae bacterium]|nr:acyl-ACP--UDP-N-acetylglucosamine O-acyltransferase [Ectothiorhodospiraceae bacterium]MCH8504390.1 acyl-ACP--UDP-N-acetylglucosamine O-acyltransferase [Ectothiorhodospiraceae bacterium]